MRRGGRIEGLPPFAMEYLANVPRALRAIRAFHLWLQRSGRPILQLEPSEVILFLEPFLAAKTGRARGVVRPILLRYFDWLHKRGLLSFAVDDLAPAANPLAPEAM